MHATSRKKPPAIDAEEVSAGSAKKSVPTKPPLAALKASKEVSPCKPAQKAPTSKPEPDAWARVTTVPGEHRSPLGERACKKLDVAIAVSNWERRATEPVIQSPGEEREFFLGNRTTPIKGGQVKYGPTRDLADEEIEAVEEHFGFDVTKRVSSYEKRHSTYVKAARESARPLTKEEARAARTFANTRGASINHVIASGTGQNLLNKAALVFDGDPDKLPDQAAAVARLQGYTRGIVQERRGETALKLDLAEHQKIRKESQVKRALFADEEAPTREKMERKINREERGKLKNQAVVVERSRLLKQTVVAMESPNVEEREEAYRDIIRSTYDSPGNIRVGGSSINTKISTGFDMPLDAYGQPTERGQRLLAVHETYAPSELLDEYGSLFTHSADGRIPGSSQEVSPPIADPDKTPPTPRKP